MSGQVTPEVLWAQRSSSSDPEKNHIFMTIMAPDVPEKDMKLDIQPTKMAFTGTSTSKNTTYHFEIEFFAEIDPSETKTHPSGRDIELILRKKELKEEYWPRLLKDKAKVHFLKTDFGKWVDEDEQDAAPEDDDYMSRMNPMAGGGDGGFGGIDFSQLAQGAGGMPGMPDMSSMGDMGAMGGDGDGDDDDDDDDMPDLEGDDTPTAKVETGKPAESVPAATGETGASATKTSKIEEVE